MHGFRLGRRGENRVTEPAAGCSGKSPPRRERRRLASAMADLSARSDTSRAAVAARLEVLRRMGPGGRLRAGLRFSRDDRALSRRSESAEPRPRRTGGAAPLDRAELRSRPRADGGAPPGSRRMDEHDDLGAALAPFARRPPFDQPPNISSRRRCISSGERDSMSCEMIQTCPNGSSMRPARHP